MHKIFRLVLAAASLVVMSSCGAGSGSSSDALQATKAKLADLKAQQTKLNQQISDLEAQLAKADPSSVVAEKAKLVSLSTLAPTSFTHFIDLQGNVEAVNISYIAPSNGTGGVVRERLVSKGDRVTKGQLLLKLDDALQRQQLVNAKTQLDYAKDLYQRRKNLWDQRIGTEVDVVNAQNQVDMAQNQLKVAQQQLDFTDVRADIDGTVDDITVQKGEMFTGMQQLRLINTDNLKVVVQVPEVYEERVRVGSPVQIALPELNNMIIQGTVHVMGKVINAGSRTFPIEVRIPNNKDIRANQIAIVKVQDYAAKGAIVVPVNTLQNDEKGKFVMVGIMEDGKLVAHKKPVTIGLLYADQIEIKSGLAAGDRLITDGFQSLYERQLITTQ
jgi:membrane fusion protein, multidrug efflux system